MKRIVAVTGASGFIGRHLCAGLAGRGWMVRALVRHAPDQWRPSPNLGHVRISSLQDIAPLREALRAADAVVHLAGLAHAIPAPSETDLQLVNVDGTAAVARAAAAERLRRLVFVSSIKVNGERTEGRPFTADDAPAPEDSYGRSKLRAEQALTKIASESQLDSVIIRPPLVYGPGVRANVARLASVIERGWPLPFGSVGNRRTMISVWNLCDLIAVALEHPRAAGQIFLAGDARPVSTPEFVRLIAGAIGRPARLFPVPVAALRLAGRLAGRSGMASRLLDSLEVGTGATERELAWRPPLSVEQGIRRSFAPAAGRSA
jgi:nucleoside-diphosphate-sugar epimerase